MKITIICVGSLKDPALLSMIEEYSRRVGPGTKLNWIEVKDEKLGRAPDEAALKAEAGRIFDKWPKDAHVVALDSSGAQFDSLRFADFVSARMNSGKDLAFIIGGPFGLHSSVPERADKRLSLSRLTFPHRLVRLILAEQLYRAFSIIRGEPYHK